VLYREHRQPDPACGECLHGLQDVDGIATQPVELPYHHRVALAHVIEEGGQAGAVIACTRHGVRERLRNPCRFQRRVLLIECLRDRGDTGVTDPGTGAGALQAVRTVCETENAAQATERLAHRHERCQR
jgi:hypothetical protein